MLILQLFSLFFKNVLHCVVRVLDLFVETNFISECVGFRVWRKYGTYSINIITAHIGQQLINGLKCKVSLERVSFVIFNTTLLHELYLIF